MRIAISSMAQGLDSQMSPVFGRCPYFVFVDVDMETKEIKNEKSVVNSATMQAGGAGIMSAQLIANEKAEAVISGATGPRAFGVLQQLGIKIFQGVPKTVRENISLFIEGKLKEISAPGPMGFGQRGFGRGMGRRRAGRKRGFGNI
ncbi:MAG: hypothetical protein B6U68_02635 [Candidatus Aenigmarchaeota archaeon ex4484_14]|nr:MAG: hypothetical protein B6U68_02635 [Candidatus Aenigmarchaeota archaeon ex4484_14]